MNLNFLKNRRPMNKKGFVWLIAAVPAALAGLLIAWKYATTPTPSANSAAGIISAMPIYGWVIIGLVILVLLRR
jgi:hypothetical protein